MRRTLAAIAALALVAALGPTASRTLGPVPLPGGSDRAAAADCTWQRHSKRVVKRIRRDGKLRRVVRKRHWWSCDPIAAVPALGSPPAVLPAPNPTPAPPAPEPEPEPANRVGVKALEYSYTLSRPSVLAGEVTVELNNQGEDPHNLHLQRQDSEDPVLEIAETGPDSNRSASFVLAAGKYRLWCSLEQHDEWGMNASLVVASP